MKTPTLWKHANEAFRNGDFNGAIALYEEILNQVDDSSLKAQLNFNLHLTRRRLGHPSPTKYATSAFNQSRTTDRTLFFDADFYLENNPDVKIANIDPETHYWSSGEREGRFPNTDFDPNFYLRTNADVRLAKLSPYKHYIESGYLEGRICKSPLSHDKRPLLGSSKPLLFVGHDGIQAGSEVVLLEVIRWFYENTPRRIKLLLLEPGPLVNLYARYADIYVLPKDTVDNPTHLKEFLSDTFQFTYLNTVVCGRFLKITSDFNITLKSPIVAHIHEMEKVLNTFSNELHRLKESVTHWISASPATTHTLIEKHSIHSDNITTVPAFIQPVADENVAYNEHQQEARRMLGLADSAFVVMGCGTIYWRKGTDIFVETARALRRLSQAPVTFVWIGQGPEQSALEASLTEEEKHFIKFVGNKNNANFLLAAADVFFLSSREDPFPLVVLESAQHGIPSICFATATGITAFIEQDAGIALTDISAESAATSLFDLLKNSHRRQQLGKKARQKLFEGYTAEKQNLKIYDALVRHTAYRPSVSVIVPFYNHQSFVQERMDSIINQSIKDIEIIILDDCSSDQTIEKTKPYLNDRRIRLIQNKSNSGSPFKQWEKGISQAQSEIVWIAEGDDSCEQDFLSKLLPYFNDPMVHIAAARTENMDEFGQINPHALMPYLDMAYPDKFQTSYLLDGFTEVNQQLGAMCTLVNASGLLIRKSSFGHNLVKAQQFKMCGDWLIYLECLRGGKIAYDTSTTNYFRRHNASQVHSIEGTAAYFSERHAITEYMLDNYIVTKQIVKRAFLAVEHEWARFQHKHEKRELTEFYDKTLLQKKTRYRKYRTHVALYVHGMLFSKGGIERLASQLANHLAELGWQVTIYCRKHTNSRAIYPLYESVRIVPIFDEHRLDYSAKALSHALLKDNVDVFVPMLSEWLFDPIVSAAKKTGVAIVASEHNDPWKIEELWWNREERIACFEKVDAIHLLLEKFTESLPAHLHHKVVTIPNGVKITEKPVPVTREKLILSVGRLEAQKRFDRLIDAANFAQETLRQSGHRIEIYGEGSLRPQLEAQILKHGIKDIVFLMGNRSDIDDVYARGDFFVIPSEFEGFGIVIIEALSFGMPVIGFRNCNGPNEIVLENQCGALVNDTRELSEILKNYADSDLSGLRPSCRERASQYSTESTLSTWTKTLSKLF